MCVGRKAREKRDRREGLRERERETKTDRQTDTRTDTRTDTQRQRAANRHIPVKRVRGARRHAEDGVAGGQVRDGIEEVAPCRRPVAWEKKRKRKARVRDERTTSELSW